MATMLGSLLVSLGLESGEFKSGLSAAEKDLKKTTRSIERMGRKIGDMGQNLTVGVTAPLVLLAKKSVEGFIDQEKAMADVNAALKSMGAASGKTGKELAKTADAMELRSLFDADVILKQVTANLLTFGNVAGKQFDRAQQSAIDMAERLGTEPQSAAIMLGKALNDPIKGITALTRVGVQFTDQQRAQIEAMTKAGDTAGAQGIILTEVEKQFKGAAAAAADASPWRQAQVNIAQAMDKIGEAILPLIGPVSDAIAGIASAFANLPEPIQEAAVVAGVFAAALGPVLMVLGPIVSAMAPFLAQLKIIAAAQGVFMAAGAGVAGLTAAFAPFALAAGGAYLIWKNWDSIGPILEDLGKGLGLLQTDMEAASTGLSSAFENIAGAAVSSGVRTEAEAQKIRDALSAMTSAGVVDPAAGEEITNLVYQMEQAGTIAPQEAEKVRAALREAWKQEGLPKSDWEELGEIVASFGDFLAEEALRQKRVGDSFIEDNKAMAQGLWDGWKFAEAKFTEFHASLQETGANIKAWFSDMAAKMTKIGGDIIAGLVRGIKAAPGAVKDALFSVVNSGVQSVKNFLGIRSPSRLFMEIGENISAGLGLGIKAGASKAEIAMQELAGRMQMLMERLYPQMAKIRDMNAELNDIDASEKAGKISGELAEDMRFRTKQDARGVLDKEIPLDFMKQGPLVAADEIEAAAERTARALGLLKDKATVQTVRVGQSFKDMADQTIGALDRIIGAIKGDGFLDILGAVIGLATQLGSIGVFGKSIQKNINNVPAYAGGTNFHPGGLALVGERGPELVSMPTGSKVFSNANSQAMMGGPRVEVIPSPYFDVRVDGRIVSASPSIMAGGAQVASSRMSRKQSRRVG